MHHSWSLMQLKTRSMELIAFWLQPIYEIIRATVMDNKYVQIDERRCGEQRLLRATLTFSRKAVSKEVEFIDADWRDFDCEDRF